MLLATSAKFGTSKLLKNQSCATPVGVANAQATNQQPAPIIWAHSRPSIFHCNCHTVELSQALHVESLLLRVSGFLCCDGRERRDPPKAQSLTKTVIN